MDCNGKTTHMKDLVDAICIVSQEIAAISETDSPDRALRADLKHLHAMLFNLRFARTGGADDLDNIITMLTEHTKEYEHSPPAIWCILGNALQLKYEVQPSDTGFQEVLDQAVDALRQSMELDRTADNPALKAARLARYCGALVLRLRRKAVRGDFDLAVSSIFEALTVVNNGRSSMMIGEVTTAAEIVKVNGGVRPALDAMDKAITMITDNAPISEDWPIYPRDKKNTTRVRCLNDIVEVTRTLHDILQRQAPSDEMLTHLLAQLLGLKSSDEVGSTSLSLPEIRITDGRLTPTTGWTVVTDWVETARNWGERFTPSPEPPPRRRPLGTTGLENMGTP